MQKTDTSARLANTALPQRYSAQQRYTHNEIVGRAEVRGTPCGGNRDVGLLCPPCQAHPPERGRRSPVGRGPPSRIAHLQQCEYLLGNGEPGDASKLLAEVTRRGPPTTTPCGCTVDPLTAGGCCCSRRNTASPVEWASRHHQPQLSASGCISGSQNHAARHLLRPRCPGAAAIRQDPRFSHARTCLRIALDAARSNIELPDVPRGRRNRSGALDAFPCTEIRSVNNLGKRRHPP